MEKKTNENQLKEVNRQNPEVEAVTKADLKKALKDATDRGLAVDVDGDTYTMKFSGREDSGNLHQPVEAIVAAANRLLGPKEQGDEEVRQQDDANKA